MKQTTYRVEAFIVPIGNEYCTDSDHYKSSNMRKKLHEINNTILNIEENDSDYTQNEKRHLFLMEKENMQNLKNDIISEKVERNLETSTVNKNNPVHFYSTLDIPRTKYKVLYNIHDKCFSFDVPDNICRLSTIAEKNEDSVDKPTEICYHGCKNGCSATVPAPQQVTEEVFKENWLQKLEDIKQREALLKNKEINLQNRETILIKKEKEIKIMEYLLKNRLKQIDLYSKENKHLQDLLKVNNLLKNTSGSCTSVDSTPNDLSVEKSDSTVVNKLNLCMQTVNIQDVPQYETVQVNKHINTIGVTCKDLQQEKTNTNSSSDNSIPEEKRSKKQVNLKSSMSLKLSSSRFTRNSNNKLKKPCKVSYEDLDTTLSADIGDSSFFQTSQKFNPDMYRKPYAFTRAASERRGKCIANGSDTNLKIQILSNPREEFQAATGIEQNKVLRRVTQNISASQDKGTKFQHYGLIDHNMDTNKVHKLENEKKYSYLNLETSNRVYSRLKSIESSKGRPLSWNEETNEWLQKKRKAYNMTIKKVISEETDKENFKHNAKTNKSDKMVIKNDIKNKILTMFR
ncbi:uncharacterized protein LOC143184748 [Calliopsis andreniformis]|uniref:uncharacterized protein LOC143184748 n=1 Tax=Calliopsis andreniformis TaxID=337506 RepID=UPI003FCE0E89